MAATVTRVRGPRGQRRECHGQGHVGERSPNVVLLALSSFHFNIFGGGRRTERWKGGGRDGGKEREKEEEADGGDVGVVRSVTMLSRGSATLDCNRMGRWTRRPRRTRPPPACTRRPRLAAHVGRKRMGIGSGGSGCEIICRLVPCLREGDGVTLECIGRMNGRS